MWQELSGMHWPMKHVPKGLKPYFNMNKLTEQNITIQGRWHIFKTASKIRKIPITCIGRLWLTDYKQRAGTGHTPNPEDRYNKKSTIIVSQLPVDKWAQVISDPTIGDAIVDRIIYNAHRIELKGTSMRENQSKWACWRAFPRSPYGLPRQGSSAELSPLKQRCNESQIIYLC